MRRAVTTGARDKWRRRRMGASDWVCEKRRRRGFCDEILSAPVTMAVSHRRHINPLFPNRSPRPRPPFSKSCIERGRLPPPLPPFSCDPSQKAFFPSLLPELANISPGRMRETLTPLADRHRDLSRSGKLWKGERKRVELVFLFSFFPFSLFPSLHSEKQKFCPLSPSSLSFSVVIRITRGPWIFPFDCFGAHFSLALNVV